MQTITPLTNEDFEKPSTVVISKVEIDIDGEGDFQELPDILSYSISTNEEDRVAKFCSYSFSIICLNTDNRYGLLEVGSSYYGWLKQGRRIKLWAGIKKDGSEYLYQFLLGRIDDPKLSTRSGEEICTITGRSMMRMLLEYKLYFLDTYWGTDISYNTVANQMTYSMEADCKGIYKVELDSTSPYDGSNLEEIFENRDWTYDWNLNKLVFVSRKAPDFAGTNNLKVYYFQTQNVEEVVGDILLAAGVLANDAARTAWLASAYCTATGETIDRVWFKLATLSSKAITLLAEVVQYRFSFDYEGNPIFRPKATIGAAVGNVDYADVKILDENQSIDEVYTHVIVIGEERDRIAGDDETAPAVPTGLALSSGFGESTQAGLAYVKADWDANTESDFGHYELRIKKNADSDYTEVSTIATSFMFLGLEPGVTYNIQVRACDIYENRSDWCTVVNQVTATDAGTPAQTAGQTATAIVAGIKIEWTKNSESNIAYYLVERQESPDNIDWSAGWVEISRINGDMWLDLLLTYSKYYRYRITAYTVAGVAGVTSANTTAIQPNQVDALDIAAKCITAAEIYGLKLSVIFADMGQITAGDITLDSNGFIRTSGKDNYASDVAGFWLGYDTDKYKLNIGDATQYLKWDGANLAIKGSITLENSIPYTNVSNVPILPPDTNLVGYWSLNEGTGSKAKDSSGNGNDGTLVAMEEADWVKGVSGQCLNFDGLDEYINIDNPILGATAFTISLWCKKTAYTQYQGIIADYDSSHRNLILGYENPENTLTLYIGDGTSVKSIAATGFTQDVWHHIVAVYDAATNEISLYIDLVKTTDTTTIANIGSVQSAACYIGRYSSFKFNGFIDEVRLYNIALTAEQAKALYENPSGLTTGTNPGADITGDNNNWSEVVDDDSNKPDNNADVTLAAINGELSITGGGIVLTSGGAKIRGGQTAYATGTGFWLGDVSGTPKFSIGSSTRYMKWDGTKLDIQGNISVGGTGSEQEILFKDSSIYMYDWGAGGGVGSKGIVIGDATTKYLSIFAETGDKNGYIRLYGDDTGMDSYTGIRTLGEAGYRYTQIVGCYSDKYSYIKLIPTTTTDTFEFQGTGSTDRIINLIKGTNTASIKATATNAVFKCQVGSIYNYIYMYPHATDGSGYMTFFINATTNKNFEMYNDGRLKLPNLGSNPSAGASGDICVVNGVLKSYQSGWKTVTVT